MTEKANNIYTQNYEIIESIIKKGVDVKYNDFIKLYMSKEDLEQELRLNLIKELDNFDEKEVDLKSFCGQINKYRIGVIMGYYNAEKRNNIPVSIHKVNKYDETLEEILIYKAEKEEFEYSFSPGNSSCSITINSIDLFRMSNSYFSKKELEVLKKLKNGTYEWRDKKQDNARERLKKRIYTYFVDKVSYKERKKDKIV